MRGGAARMAGRRACQRPLGPAGGRCMHHRLLRGLHVFCGAAVAGMRAMHSFRGRLLLGLRKMLWRQEFLHAMQPHENGRYPACG